MNGIIALTSSESHWEQRMSRPHTPIRDRYAPSVLQELSPSVGKSTADYGEHAVDDRIRGRQSNRSTHLGEIPQLYGGFRARVLAWVSYGAYGPGR